jgi:hypothetical protein
VITAVVHRQKDESNGSNAVKREFIKSPIKGLQGRKKCTCYRESTTSQKPVNTSRSFIALGAKVDEAKKYE